MEDNDNQECPADHNVASVESPKEEIAAGLSLMLGDDFWHTAEPLFAASEVDIVEWSFDMGWGRPLPIWLNEVLADYSARGRLLGHGVSYSALDASDTPRQEAWLAQLSIEVQQHQYRHISEHFGFMGGGNFHISSPLPVPRTDASVAVGQSRLRELSSVAKVPVGLENLAFAFGPDDVKQQGPFLEELLRSVDGFLLLDLHNIYCQSCNFDVDMLSLLDDYPLDRVRELHVSGGSWSEHPPGSGNQIRRDTHDDVVPEAIFHVLPEVLTRCAHVEAVILERLDGTIDKENDDAERFRADFRRLKSIVVGEAN